MNPALPVTATTPAPDGKDQNCNGIIDEEQPVISQVVLNSGSGQSCDAVCNSIGASCTSIGLDANGSDSKYADIFAGCAGRPGASCSWVIVNAGGAQRMGILLDWTRCKCYAPANYR